MIHVPVGWVKLWRTEVDWDYRTMPEEHCATARVTCPRGKTLGGSSSINAMVYIRGNRLDYDTWARDGATGWSYDELLPYFMRAENNERGADAWHATGGPLNVADSRSRNPMAQAFVDAAVAAGPRREPRLQRRRAGRVRLVPADPARRDALLDRGRLPAPGAGAARTSRSRASRRSRGSCSRAPRGRRRLHARWARRTIVPRRARGHRLRRRLQLAAGPDALRRSARRSCSSPTGSTCVLDQPQVGANLQDHARCGLTWTADEPVSLVNAATPEALAEFETSSTGR